ncbi:MAG: hypothetical protein K1X89_05885 [Myxococcaceae bacterium]|nr:hypothetical protein [Myxococcaceae bacterium]
MPLTFAALLAVSLAAAPPKCAEFDAQLSKTYGFRPAKLSPDERKAKNAELDAFWAAAKSHGADWVPCLRAALKNPKRDHFFAYDGAQLLRSLSQAAEDQQLLLEAYRDADFDDVQLREWVEGLSRLGFQGVDTSSAAARWFTLPKPQYNVPEHAQLMGLSAGALFLYGAMDEAVATPALIALAKKKNPLEVQRTLLYLLARQNTPAATAFLKGLTCESELCPKEAAPEVLALRKGEGRLTPRASPKVTRERFVAAFEGILKKDWKAFDAINHELPDAELDLVAVLEPGDLPLLRKVRRLTASYANPHMAKLYDELSRALYTLTFERAK